MVILLVNVAAVLFMTGCIWTMQLVHYPLFNRIGADALPGYEADHNRLFFLVAGPGIILTLVTGVSLPFVRPSAQIPLAAAIAGLLLFTAMVISTALLQAPRHAIVSDGFDRNAYEFLLRTNWIRTVAWSAYGLPGFWMVWQAS